jgi:translation elongation factor P/translation initiation factor 5A
MATTNDLKNGMVLNLDGQLWQVIWFQHHKPGKGGAVVRTKLKNVESGKTVDKTFNADVKVDVANVDKRTMQYLYNDGTSYVFMDTGTYDQLEVSPDVVGDGIQLPAGEPGGDRRPPTTGACSTSSCRPPSSSRSPTRARPAGRPLDRRHQARHGRDRRDRQRAALHHHRREDQGRHPRLLVPRPRHRLS